MLLFIYLFLSRNSPQFRNNTTIKALGAYDALVIIAIALLLFGASV